MRSSRPIPQGGSLISEVAAHRAGGFVPRLGTRPSEGGGTRTAGEARALNDWMKIAGRSRLLQRDVRLAGNPYVGGGSVPRPSATQAFGALERRTVGWHTI